MMQRHGYLAVLFVCGKNRLRSPTAEHVFADWPGVETLSAGVNHDADTVVTPELLQWADLVLVMERSHRSKLSRKYSSFLASTRIGCLDISDDFEFMADDLIALLKAKVPPYLPGPG